MDEAGSGLFAVVLAAGGSRRLGRPKQLLMIDGETLIRRTLRRADGLCGERVLAVLGRDWRRVLAAAGDAAGFFVINERWQDGLGASLALGMRGLPRDCEAVLILLADQPLVDADDLARLAAAWQKSPARITASRYDDTIGVPAIIPRSFFPELLTLDGDRGAKSLLLRNRERLNLVECEHARLDIDTPEDAALLRRPRREPD